MKMSIKLISSIVLIITAVGCNSKSDGNKPAIVAPTVEPAVVEPLVVELATNGVWNTPEYGYIFDVNEENVQIYQYTENFCQTFDLGINDDDFINSMQISENKTSMISTVAGLKVPGLTAVKQDNLPENCITDLVANIGDDGYVYDPERDFEIFWQTFEQHYAFFSIEGVDWNEIYQIASNQVNQDTSEEDLFEILAAMVSPLKDFHVQLENETIDEDFEVSRKPTYIANTLTLFLEENELTPPLNQEQFNSFDEFLSDNVELSQEVIAAHLTEVKFNEQETLFWGVTEGNIGYINILTMELSGLVDSNNNIEDDKNKLLKIIDQLMADLINTKGIVVDIRYNDGGFDFIGHMLISRWINNDLHAYSKQVRLGDSRTPLVDFIIEPQGNIPFLGPIALLTSTATSSAAETFAMAVRERDNTVLIGEATGGGISDTLPKSLPHGTEFTLSNEFYLTPNGESFEGVGVPVSIEQDFFTQEQLQLEQDFGLEKAISWISLQENNL